MNKHPIILPAETLRSIAQSALQNWDRNYCDSFVWRKLQILADSDSDSDYQFFLEDYPHLAKLFWQDIAWKILDRILES